jgi:hypothetical protein
MVALKAGQRSDDVAHASGRAQRASTRNQNPAFEHVSTLGVRSDSPPSESRTSRATRLGGGVEAGHRPVGVRHSTQPAAVW